MAYLKVISKDVEDGQTWLTFDNGCNEIWQELANEWKHKDSVGFSYFQNKDGWIALNEIDGKVVTNE